MKSTQWLSRNLVTSPYYYTICTDEKRFEKEMVGLKVKAKDVPDFLGSPNADGTTHFFDKWDGNRIEGKSAIVCVRYPAAGKTGCQYAGLLVHEAVHIWQAIRETLGERHPGSEQEACSIQSIAQELMIEFMRQTTGRKRK